MNSLGSREYTGDGKLHFSPLPGAWNEPEPYVAPPALVEAVNMAIYLRRPLLLEGEPGSGKTRLAYAVAYEIGLPIRPIYIRSTSKAQDLLYNFDALGRLYDIQELRTGTTEKFPDKGKYIKLGSLGEAIQMSEQDKPSVVLIDEIDKADIDFPNDLLQVLDRLQFQVDEIPTAKEWSFDALKSQSLDTRRRFLPVIIITSNREKELPGPFLRRCLFNYIDFPDGTTLKQIVERHFQMGITPLFEEALKKFWGLRSQQRFVWRKKPSTSELLDWLRVLEHDKRITAEKLAATSLGDLPYVGALVKTQSDLNVLPKLAPDKSPDPINVAVASPGTSEATNG